MKNNMEDIDQLIKDTLTQEEAKFYNELDEQNVIQMMGGLFKGKNKWMMLLINFVMVVWFVLFVYCAIHFFKVEDTNELIKWAVGGSFSIMAVGVLKLFAWMQMDKNALLREMKRLELQVSSLATKLSQ